ncbi:hypothetical protein H2200_011377 [Cladophialophora chaetospira]|uniref:DNA recombination and repair protein Rad51-like C-terminal domain-containing protein n=1 Tax=Cladophialophora chaetospira TaxID=386627 RepID=A0AA38WZ76_9EURO|nr:hypothetical protein H2200_011377 [Cladophialophora chaetospira]
MSAEQYGARLLEEVQEQSLDKLRAELRNTICPQPRAVLGVLQVDKLLEEARFPNGAATTPHRPVWQSTAADSPAFREGRSESEDQDDPDTSPRRFVEAPKPKPATIELTSQKSASGKTTLLSHLIGISVLPKYLGGKESTAIYIDADGRFSAMRLAQLMHHYIHRHSKKPATTSLSDVDMIIKESLDHIHVFRPQSSTQLLSILSHLPGYLFDASRHQSMHRPLSMIILDSATTFFWQDRFDRTMARLETPGTTIEGPSTTQQVIERLKHLQERFDCVVLFSTTSTTPASIPQRQVEVGPTTPAPEDTGRVISPWTAYATLTLNLSRVPVPQFAPQMSMEECLRDRERRFEAVRKGRFVAVVISKREGERRAGGFGFAITTDGVEIE